MSTATESYIRDLSLCLKSGDLSDLTLNFRDKTWQTHKALACSHSKWFLKAITSGYTETFSGVITLNDDPEFADAIDCMVSYFYDASYDTSKFNTLESLLHAQVVTIADKYDCGSLYKLAKTLFADTVKAIASDDWPAIATFIYYYATTEAPAHVELRHSVVDAVSRRPFVLKSVLRNEIAVELLRTNSDLAIDMLLGGPHGPMAKDVTEHIFMCDCCRYVHVGHPQCSFISPGNSDGLQTPCPLCQKTSGTMSKRFMHRVATLETFSCSSCGGFHTAAPEPKPEPEIADEPGLEPEFAL